MQPRTNRIAAFLLCASLLICAGGRAQDSERRIKLKDLPTAVRKTVDEQSQGATLRGLSKEVENGKTFYEAELKIDGHNKDVLIDASGTVVEIEEQVALASLPPNVKATLDKAVGNGKILRIESITKNNSIEAYEAHVNKAGKRSEIKVAADGQLITREK